MHRDELKAISPTTDTSLPAMWNAYDSWNVWRTYRVGSPMPNITDDQFDMVRNVSDAPLDG